MKELSVLRALYAAATEVIGNLSDEEKAFEVQRRDLMHNRPELTGALFREMTRTIDMFSGIVAARTGHDPSEPKVRAMAGAAVGAFYALGDGAVDAHFDLILFLEEGMPLD